MPASPTCYECAKPIDRAKPDTYRRSAIMTGMVLICADCAAGCPCANGADSLDTCRACNPRLPAGARMAAWYWFGAGAFDYDMTRGRVRTRRIGRRTTHANNIRFAQTQAKPAPANPFADECAERFSDMPGLSQAVDALEAGGYRIHSIRITDESSCQ